MLVNSGASWRMHVVLSGAEEFLGATRVQIPFTVTYYVICE